MHCLAVCKPEQSIAEAEHVAGVAMATAEHRKTGVRVVHLSTMAAAAVVTRGEADLPNTKTASDAFCSRVIKTALCIIESRSLYSSRCFSFQLDFKEVSFQRQKQP